MPARDLRVAAYAQRLKSGNAFLTLLIISALLTLPACATTTSSSVFQSGLLPETTLAPNKSRTTANVAGVAKTEAAPTESSSAAAEAAPAQSRPAAAADGTDVGLQSRPEETVAAAGLEAAPALEAGGNNPPTVLIDAEACTQGLRGEWATARAGNSLLSGHGLYDDEAEAEVRLASILTVMPAAPSAGAGEIVPSSAAPTALNVKVGQTEGLLVAAYQQTGRSYKAGGQTPATGFDSPGFTRWVYSQRGLNLPREAKGQAAAGRQVAKEDLRPGDLLVYRDPASKNEAEYHVGIYTGRGNFLHAAAKSGVVTETAAFGPEFAPYFVGGRRYYDDPKAAPLSDNQKMAAASSAVKLALSELGPNDKLDRSIIKSKPKSSAKSKKK